MSEDNITPSPAEGETSLLFFLVKLVFTAICVPPLNIVTIGSIGVIIYVVNRFRYPHCNSKAKMKGKTVIITGANKGLGLEAGRDLARRGATVILACRDVIKGNIAHDDILESVNGKVEVMELDVSSLASVRKFAKAFGDRKIDVLINNAGIADVPWELTDEGLELTVATNHLGHFLLNHLLMPGLKAAKGRIVNVTSIAHNWIKDAKDLDLDNDMKFQYSRPLKTLELYAASKLMMLQSSNELCRRLKGCGVTTNCIHPGVVNTDIFNEMTSRVWYGPFVKLFVLAYAKNPIEGAQTLIHAAVSEELEGVSGKYFEDCKETIPSKLALDEKLSKKVWNLSERLVQLQPQEKTI